MKSDTIGPSFHSCHSLILMSLAISGECTIFASRRWGLARGTREGGKWGKLMEERLAERREERGTREESGRERQDIAQNRVLGIKRSVHFCNTTQTLKGHYPIHHSHCSTWVYSSPPHFPFHPLLHLPLPVPISPHPFHPYSPTRHTPTSPPPPRTP